ncbi:hypothetical protein EYF80_026246 [Liparis tanakae]|uniref:Uncharacterized protein n=1 Tax=Liparis tanakae TaxID=230148 RepID=A0A4Z2HF07_9TELE|nr:hypothetical protein EYF80_026246 [Liparis tanakae]
MAWSLFFFLYLSLYILLRCFLHIQGFLCFATCVVVSVHCLGALSPSEVSSSLSSSGLAALSRGSDVSSTSLSSSGSSMSQLAVKLRNTAARPVSGSIRFEKALAKWHRKYSCNVSSRYTVVFLQREELDEDFPLPPCFFFFFLLLVPSASSLEGRVRGVEDTGKLMEMSSESDGRLRFREGSEQGSGVKEGGAMGRPETLILQEGREERKQGQR